MPGTELYGADERKEINDVLDTGVFFRFNHEAQRNNIWKAKDFEAEAKKITVVLTRHVPINTKNSPTKLLVPGIAILPIVNNKNKIADNFIQHSIIF